jgi:hypothetical protein
MLELTNVNVQEVTVNGAVLFDTVALKTGCGAERHRQGSSQITLVKGGVYQVTFNADIATPTAGTADTMTLTLAVNAEALTGAEMSSTPGAVDDYNNISTTHLIRVCMPCCIDISVLNTSTQAVNVKNANIVVERLG